MKPCDIQVGRTYQNRGAGRTRRKVLEISDQQRPTMWWSDESTRPNEPGVMYEQDGRIGRLYISSFAAWCGSEVTADELAAGPAQASLALPVAAPRAGGANAVVPHGSAASSPTPRATAKVGGKAAGDRSINPQPQADTAKPTLRQKKELKIQ